MGRVAFPSDAAVRLGWDEMQHAAHGAALRRARELANSRAAWSQKIEVLPGGAIDVWGPSVDEGIALDVVRRHFNRYTLPFVVRAARGSHDAHLVIHGSDPNDRRIVLVWLHETLAWVAGWCYGRDSKRQRFRRTRFGTPCFMVPVSELRPIDTLQLE